MSRLTKVSKATLLALSRRPDLLPFEGTCPVCYSRLKQSTIGEIIPRREFSCTKCKFWALFDDDAIREGIEQSRDGGEGEITGSGYGGSALWNPHTGEIEFYCSIQNTAYLRGEPLTAADWRALAAERRMEEKEP